MRTFLRYLFVIMLFSCFNFAYAKTFGASICNDEQYTCYKVQRGESWEKLFPDKSQRDLVMRINRMNVPIYSKMTIAVPRSLDADLMSFSPMPKQIDPVDNKTIVVDMGKLAFGAYDQDGKLEHWGPVSTARGYCPDMHRSCHTVTGTFSIYRKEGSGCVSKIFPVGRGGAPMPYCMYFHGGFALHGSYEVPGYNASHGCVRMFVDDARWLNQEFTADSDKTTVIVHQ